MTAKFEVGQMVEIDTGETMEIYRIEEFGSSIFYEGWVRGMNVSKMMLIHQKHMLRVV